MRKNRIEKLIALSCNDCEWCHNSSCKVTDPDGVEWPCIKCGLR